MEEFGGEKMHSSKTSAQRPITIHFWRYVESGSRAEGQQVCLGGGWDWKSRVWLAMGLEKAATDQSKRRDLMTLAFMGSYLNTWVLPDHPRGTHKPVHMEFPLSILVPPS